MGRLTPMCILALLVGAPGCDDLKDFRGEFDGSIVDGNFVRSCFPAESTATLEFDPDQANSDKSGKYNRLTTSDGTFDDTPLVSLAALPHDQLSRFDFPGPARVSNYVLMARPKSGPLEGRDVTVFISLLKSDLIEVRVMGRSAPTTERCPTDEVAEGGVEEDPSVREYFAVFRVGR